MKKWISIVGVGLLCLPLLFNVQALEILRLKVFDASVQTPDPTGFFVTLNRCKQRGRVAFPQARLSTYT
mgnify:CR=1 FL=1